MKKYVKNTVAVICAIALFGGCDKLLSYILIDDTTSYTRLSFHELYTSNKNIDIAFVGSSHVYRSLNPYITDEKFGKYTFNAGSSSQFLDGSYAWIKEICSYNNVEKIYLELYYGVAEGSDYKDRTQLTATYAISDYMRPSLNKLQFLLDASSAEWYPNSFILARRNWRCLFCPQEIIDIVLKKQTYEYKHFQWIDTEDTDDYYVDRGFWGNDTVVASDKFWNETAYGSIAAVNNISTDSDWYKSLQSIIKYCKRKNIDLILFVAPEPEWTIVGKGNYQAYSDMLLDIARQNEIEFYDFNLCKADYFDANDCSNFKDEDHLNTTGAKCFSELFSDFFSGKIDANDLFYNSLETKLMEESPIVYGVAGPHQQDGEYKAYILSNRIDGLEYKITATLAESGRQRIIQDFSTNKDFKLPIDEHGTLKVSWRGTTDKDNIQSIEFEY